MWGLVPNSVRSRESFVRKYMSKNPNASKRVAVQKHKKAMRCMFGVDEEEVDGTQRRSRKRKLDEPDTENDEAGGASAGAGGASAGAGDASAGAGGASTSAGAGGATFNNDFTSNLYLPHFTGRVPTNKEHDELRQHFIEVSSIKDCHLAPWMEEILLHLPEEHRKETSESVWMDPTDGSYIFGVCGTNKREAAYFLEMVHRLDHPILSGCFDKEISFVDGMEYFEHGNLEQLRMFVNDESYSACMVAIGCGAGRSSHASAIYKDRTSHTLVFLDPQGEPKPDMSIETVMDEINAFLQSENLPYTRIGVGQQYMDQAYGERSCFVAAFMRILYTLFRSYTDPAHHPPVHYRNERVPCVFAVFVSKLFQAVDVIDEHTLHETLKKTSQDLVEIAQKQREDDDKEYKKTEQDLTYKLFLDMQTESKDNNDVPTTIEVTSLEYQNGRCKEVLDVHRSSVLTGFAEDIRKRAGFRIRASEVNYFMRNEFTRLYPIEPPLSTYETVRVLHTMGGKIIP
jgi:hypothetical protein